MKNNLLFILLIIIITGTAFQITTQPPSKKLYIPNIIKDANRLGLGNDKYKEDFPTWYKKGFSGVMMPLPNGKVKMAAQDSVYVSSYYVDVAEVCNLHYRAFLEWNRTVQGAIPQVYQSLLPDTSIWLKQFYKDSLGGLLMENYLRDPAFDYYPVVGVSWEQAQAYALWRGDRMNEALLIDKDKISPYFYGQSGENHFNTLNYLWGMYESTPGAQPIIDCYHGSERRVNYRDGLLLPNYRLPTPAELQYATTKSFSYKKNKALKRYKEQIEMHGQNYPLPTYYKLSSNKLPKRILTPSQEASYYTDKNVEEWTQQHYYTSDQYRLLYHEGLDTENRPMYYIPTWIKRAQWQAKDTIKEEWIKQEYEWYNDLAMLESATTQRANPTFQYLRGFRCVLPNLW